MQSSILYMAIVIVIAFQMAESAPVETQDLDVPVVPHGLFFLGGVHGKLYFSETNVYRKWSDAKEFCLSNNMELATIRNRAEADFLEKISDNVNFYGGFWVGGRDAGTVRQFSWDKSDTAVEDNLVYFMRPMWPSQSCLYYEGIYHNYYEVRPCSYEAQALCEFHGAS